MSLRDRWQIELDGLREQGRHRTLTQPAGIDFSSNDYLGYSKRHLAPGESPGAAWSRSGTASRLLRGNHPIWEEVEARLAAWHRTEAALIMTSGYAANEGLLSTITAAGDTVFSDQCNHASIIDGLRLGKAERIIFPHNDVNALEAQMRSVAGRRTAQQAWFIVTESLFGMEGDTAPLRELADLAERYSAHLVVDEAHATGCFGLTGTGLVDALGLRDRVLATVHTGGKALAVPGAYIACSRLLKDVLVNRCRHLIFTTALPPQIGAWWLETIAAVAGDTASRARLVDAVAYFRAAARNAGRGIDLGGADHIATWCAGEDGMAVEIALRLQQAGFDVRAIRPPTVPLGTARVRISIHADHTHADLQRLAHALVEIVLPQP